LEDSEFAEPIFADLRKNEWKNPLEIKSMRGNAFITLLDQIH
jgi:hypothetical protein